MRCGLCQGPGLVHVRPGARLFLGYLTSVEPSHPRCHVGLKPGYRDRRGQASAPMVERLSDQYPSLPGTGGRADLKLLGQSFRGHWEDQMFQATYPEEQTVLLKEKDFPPY